MNEILLRRKNKVIIEKGNATEPNNQYIVTIMKNVEVLGYTFSKELFETLQTLSKDELQKFYLELIPMLKKLVGADVVYKPMYPNFPESVMEADYIDLFINAIIHYWSCGTLYPNEEKNERLPLFEETKILFSIIFASQKHLSHRRIKKIWSGFSRICRLNSLMRSH